MTMRTFFAHLRKEQREHRVVLGAIAAAILLLTAGGAWIFRDRVYEIESGAIFYLGACTALTMLALSTELFAAEGRRDGFAFLRRMPRGLGAAFAAKVVFYVLACALTTAFGAATILLVTQVFGGALAIRDLFEVLQALDVGPVLLLPGLVTAVGLWILCLSLWVPRGAAAAGAALLLLAGLAVPVWLVLRANPAFPMPGAWVVGAAIGLVVVPLAAAAYGLLRGLRFARSPWAAAWRGLAVVFAVALPAYAAGNARLERWQDLEPDEPDVEIQGAVVARGGRFLYVNLARKDETILVRTDGYVAREPLTRPFRVDLDTGRAVPIGALGFAVESAATRLNAHTQHGGDGTAGIVAVSQRPGHEPTTWWDAARGERLKTLPAGVVTDDLVPALRADLKAGSSCRLPDGRAAWLFRGRLEHDDEGGRVVSEALPSDVTFRYGVYGVGPAWLVWTATGSTKYLMADARGKPVLLDREPVGEWNSRRLSIDRRLMQSGSGWLLVEGTTRTAVPVLGSQDEWVSPVDETHVLALRRTALTRRSLRFVDLQAGTASPAQGAPESFEYAQPVPRTGSGKTLWSFSNGRGREGGYALFDAATSRFVSWTPNRDIDASVVAVLGEDVLVELHPGFGTYMVDGALVRMSPPSLSVRTLGHDDVREIRLHR